MTNDWDLHINGYIPTKREKSEGIFFGNQLGITDFVRFSGHQEFDNLFEKVEEVGAGFDAEVGYTIPGKRRYRLFGGGYFFI